METSAKQGLNVNQAFYNMSEQIYYNMKSVMSQFHQDIDSQLSDPIQNINIFNEGEKVIKKKRCCK
jgi:hypothetical protein